MREEELLWTRMFHRARPLMVSPPSGDPMSKHGPVQVKLLILKLRRETPSERLATASNLKRSKGE